MLGRFGQSLGVFPAGVWCLSAAVWADLWALGMIFAVPSGQEWVSSYNYRLDVCREVYID
jgi:hypothetical protein